MSDAKLQPTDADREAAGAWMARTVGRGVVVRTTELRAAKDGFLAGVLAERERAAQVAWDTKVQLGDFVESNRAAFAIQNMAALQAAIVAAIRRGTP